ncbi:MAG: hypothetical protein Fur0025_18210 [Oscillatoriaceae cyanobacterium]
MESGDLPASSSADRPNYRFADIVGTAIALLTLTLPFWAIAHNSPRPVDLLPPTYLRQTGD